MHLPPSELISAKVEAYNELRRLEHTAHGLITEALSPWMFKKVYNKDGRFAKPLRDRIAEIRGIIRGCVPNSLAINFTLNVEVTCVNQIKLVLERNRIEGDVMMATFKTYRLVGTIAKDGTLSGVILPKDGPIIDDADDAMAALKRLDILKAEARGISNYWHYLL
jgi:hypothetical protein